MGTLHELPELRPRGETGSRRESRADRERASRAPAASIVAGSATAARGSSLEEGERGADVAFGFVLFVLWAFSAARVGAALFAHEVFGSDASLAFLCMVALPVSATGGWVRGRVARRPRSSPDRRSSVVLASRERD